MTPATASIEFMSPSRSKPRPAEYADASLASKPRKFGILHSSNFDSAFFKEQLAKRKLPAVVEQDPVGRRRVPRAVAVVVGPEAR